VRITRRRSIAAPTREYILFDSQAIDKYDVLMRQDEKRDFIRSKASQNRWNPDGEKILWSRHGIGELVNEGWLRGQVEAALETSEVIEDYPALHRPLPDCLVLGYLVTGEPMHAVIALDEANDRLFIVTMYKPSREEWQNDWRTRKD
jgi:hypothetical protein